MLDPRATDQEIATIVPANVGAVRALVSAVGRRVGAPETPAQLARALDALAVERQAQPVADDVAVQGRIARMLDPRWWRRSMRGTLYREAEAYEQAAGVVRRRGQVYVSDFTMRRIARRDKSSREVLERLEAVNEVGDVVGLADAADASVSNPQLRRAELMTRCRGFEEMAQFMGHEAVFLTITCPSRFHRFDAKGKPNAKWKGATPRDAQDYLCEVWARIRAEWKREGISPYGFRVAEPHHDGCPHWHILLFAPADQVGWFVARRFVADRDDSGAGLVGIAGRHALLEDAGEPGAIKHRFTCERIDTAKGSATGYIAKYISKNIDGLKEDGEGMGLDFASGKSATDASQRVRAWAKVWRIRQFQQIGGPSVTVWRELRRLGKGKDGRLQLELFEHPRSAADRGLWALFWLLQGGPDVPRRELSLKPMYVEGATGRYGDAAVQIKGVHGFDAEKMHEHVAVTRMHEWRVQRAGLAAVDAYEADRWHERELRVRHAAYFEIEEKRSGEAASTWTGVNNCTADADDEAELLRMDRLRGGGGLQLEKTPWQQPMTPIPQ
jgi:hypothetical protein